MNNYCNCQDDKCNIGNKSRNMYSIDYDSLIERLEKTRNEIDDTINLLQDKKMKDNVINNILSSDDDEIEDKQNIITNTTIPYLYKYKPYPYKYPFRWYPTVWF